MKAYLVLISVLLSLTSSFAAGIVGKWNVKNLNQPGQFVSNSFVTLRTEKSSIERVRVVGPTRTYTQVEISKTDAIKLGLNPPVRTSGDIKDSSSIIIDHPLSSGGL